MEENTENKQKEEKNKPQNDFYKRNKGKISERRKYLRMVHKLEDELLLEEKDEE